MVGRPHRRRGGGVEDLLDEVVGELVAAPGVDQQPRAGGPAHRRRRLGRRACPAGRRRPPDRPRRRAPRRPAAAPRAPARPARAGRAPQPAATPADRLAPAGRRSASTTNSVMTAGAARGWSAARPARPAAVASSATADGASGPTSTRTVTSRQRREGVCALLRAHGGDHEQPRRPRLPRQVVQQRDAGVPAVVQVVDDEQQRALRGQPRQHAGHGLERAPLLGVRAGPARLAATERVGEAGHQLGQRRGAGAGQRAHRCPAGSAASTGPRASTNGWRKSDRSAAWQRLTSARPPVAVAVATSAVRQRGLADPGLAGQQDDRRSPAASPTPRRRRAGPARRRARRPSARPPPARARRRGRVRGPGRRATGRGGRARRSAAARAGSRGVPRASRAPVPPRARRAAPSASRR